MSGSAGAHHLAQSIYSRIHVLGLLRLDFETTDYTRRHAVILILCCTNGKLARELAHEHLAEDVQLAQLGARCSMNERAEGLNERSIRFAAKVREREAISRIYAVSRPRRWRIDTYLGRSRSANLA